MHKFRDNFDEESPFHPDASSPLDRLTTAENVNETEQESHQKFQERTRDEFTQLIKEIKVSFLLFYYLLKISFEKQSGKTILIYFDLFTGNQIQCDQISGNVD